MSAWSGLWTVFHKETVDNLRDRRSLFMALVYPFVGALLLGLLLGFVGTMLRGQGDSRPRIAVAGAQHAPDLVAHLEGLGTLVLPAPAQPAAAVRAGRVDAVLAVPPDYPAALREGRPVDLQLIINATRLSTVVTVARVAQQIRDYGARLAEARLRAHGVKPELATPLRVANVNVGRTRSLAGFFINMLPPFIIFTIFVGGVYLAIDSTAGERERGSLEPLLANPVPRWQIMAGKALATLVFTAIAVVLQLAAFKAMFEHVTRGDYGIHINPDIGAFIAVFLIALPLMAFAVAVQMIVATASRSYKETQTYLGLLPLIPSLPGMLLVFVPIGAKLWMLPIPCFGQLLLIGQLMRQEPVSWTEAALASGGTLLAAAALLALASRLYERDAVLFGA